jgi:hypothetical protein
MMTLEKDVTEIIRKNLPEHLSRELQTRLALADQLQEENKTLRKIVEDKDKSLSEKTRECNELRNQENFIQSEKTRLSVLEKQISEREKKMSLLELERDLTIRHKGDLFDIISLAFKNPVVNSYRRRDLIDNSNGYAPMGSTNNNRTLSDTENTTITQE